MTNLWHRITRPFRTQRGVRRLRHPIRSNPQGLRMTDRINLALLRQQATQGYFDFHGGTGDQDEVAIVALIDAVEAAHAALARLGFIEPIALHWHNLDAALARFDFDK